MNRPVSSGLPKSALQVLHRGTASMTLLNHSLMIINYCNSHCPPREQRQSGKNSLSLNQVTFSKRSSWLGGHCWAVRGHQKWGAVPLYSGPRAFFSSSGGLCGLRCVCIPLKWRSLCGCYKQQTEDSDMVCLPLRRAHTVTRCDQPPVPRWYGSLVVTELWEDFIVSRSQVRRKDVLGLKGSWRCSLSDQLFWIKILKNKKTKTRKGLRRYLGW